MHLIFADASPVEYGAWILCLGMFVGVLTKLATLGDRFATRREFDEFRAKVEHHLEDMDDRLREVEKAQAASQVTVAGEARQEKALKVIREAFEALAERFEHK